LDSVKTYFPWLKRAGGHSPHIHPWYFYFERLAWFHPVKGPVWSEAFVLCLAIIGVGAAIVKKSPLQIFLVIYTAFSTLAYTAISYKTPWCLLNFYFGMILLAGIGATTLVELFQTRALKAAALVIALALSAQLAWQSWRARTTFAADRRNPYVYAQTSPDLLNLVQKVHSIAKVSPTGHDTILKVIAPESDYWPLPWYLRQFKNIGWYEKVPEDPYAPIIIVASKLDARLDEKSEKKWIMTGLTELRPKNFLELYVELELWKKYVETLPREIE
jgi:predicted membrane-bound mannosyltransferase